jgi:hypothetical protein
VDGTCDISKCNKPATIGFIGKELCEKHWGELAEADEHKEPKLLKKLGLYRNQSGQIVGGKS